MIHLLKIICFRWGGQKSWRISESFWGFKTCKCLYIFFSLDNVGWTIFHWTGDSYSSATADFLCVLLCVHAYEFPGTALFSTIPVSKFYLWSSQRSIQSSFMYMWNSYRTKFFPLCRQDGYWYLLIILLGNFDNHICVSKSRDLILE